MTTTTPTPDPRDLPSLLAALGGTSIPPDRAATIASHLAELRAATAILDGFAPAAGEAPLDPTGRFDPQWTTTVDR